jgi:hypothetical protein
MPVAELLPHAIGPYVALMIAGFVIGAFGHLSGLRWLVVVGITLIFLAALAFPLVLNVTDNQDVPPRPY